MEYYNTISELITIAELVLPLGCVTVNYYDNHDEIT